MQEFLREWEDHLGGRRRHPPDWEACCRRGHGDIEHCIGVMEEDVRYSVGVGHDLPVARRYAEYIRAAILARPHDKDEWHQHWRGLLEYEYCYAWGRCHPQAREAVYRQLLSELGLPDEPLGLKWTCPACQKKQPAHDENTPELTCRMCGQTSLRRQLDDPIKTRPDVQDREPPPPSLAGREPQAVGRVPEMIGRYRVVEVLGEGSFGRVCRAWDDLAARHVAIKIPHARLDAWSPDADLAETRTLARLSHPNIVTVFDVVYEDGRYCVVSMLVEGSDLGKRIQEGRLPAHVSAALAAEVAEALHHAHGHGVVHRDVKPANILLDGDGKAMLTDFGLAMRNQVRGLGPGFAGTPAYMSPEQARGESQLADHRSDVFSLGVVFYELLCGRRPFQGDTLGVREQIISSDARRPREIDAAIPGELERICLKALAKRPTERYDTGKEMAEDLRRHLLAATRPMQHLRRRVPNFAGREEELGRIAGEMRAKAGTSFSIVAVKGLGGVGKTVLAAEVAEKLAGDAALFPGGVLWADLGKETPAEAARRWVSDLSGEARDFGTGQSLQRFHELTAKRRPLVVLDNVPQQAAGADLTECLVVKSPGVATLLTTRFREAVPDGVRIEALDVLPVGEALALLLSHDGIDGDDPAAGQVVNLCGRLPLFIDVAGKVVSKGFYTLAGYAGELRRRGLEALADEDERAKVVFDMSWGHLSPAAREAFAVLALAPCDDIGPNLLQAWLKQAGWGAGRPSLVWLLDRLRAWLGWAADGGANTQRPVELLAELANASLLTPVPGRPGRFRYHDRVRDYALSKLPLRQGQVRHRLLVCWTDWDFVRDEFAAAGALGLTGQYLRLRAWGMRDPPGFAPWFSFIGGQASLLDQHRDLFFQLAANEPIDSPVSREALARKGTPEEPEVWLEWVNRPRRWAPSACHMVLRGHLAPVNGVALTADGRTAVSASADYTLRVWDLTSHGASVLQGHSGPVNGVALAANGRTAVSASDDGTLRVWDLASRRCTSVLKGHSGRVVTVALSADGRTAVSGSYDRTVRMWDLASCQCSAVLEGHEDVVLSVAVTADGRSAVSGASMSLRVWDLASGRCSKSLGYFGWLRGVTLTADGRLAVAAEGDGGSLHVLDVASQRGRVFKGYSNFQRYRNAPKIVTLMANSRWAVSASQNCTFRVWDLVSGRCSSAYRGHSALVLSVALTADGRSAVSASADCTLRVWDLTSRRSSSFFEGHSGEVGGVTLTADGLSAVSASEEDLTVRVWDLASGRCVATHLAQTEKGRKVWDEHVRVWRAAVASGVLRCQDSDAYGLMYERLGITRILRRHTLGLGHDECGLTLRNSEGGPVFARFPGSFGHMIRSPNGRHVVAFGVEGAAYILRLHTRND